MNGGVAQLQRRSQHLVARVGALLQCSWQLAAPQSPSAAAVASCTEGATARHHSRAYASGRLSAVGRVFSGSSCGHVHEQPKWQKQQQPQAGNILALVGQRHSYSSLVRNSISSSTGLDNSPVESRGSTLREFCSASSTDDEASPEGAKLEVDGTGQLKEDKALAHESEEEGPVELSAEEHRTLLLSAFPNLPESFVIRVHELNMTQSKTKRRHLMAELERDYRTLTKQRIPPSILVKNRDDFTLRVVSESRSKWWYDATFLYGELCP